MTWESQTYSFGNPDAQAPTPQQTPTSSVFPGSTFRTPQGNSNTFDNRSGWTPTFAEDYTVFNATPGRLTSTQSTFGTPRPPTLPSKNRLSPSTEGLHTGIAFPVVDESESPHSPLPFIESGLQLGSSFNQTTTASGRGSESADSKKTPNKPTRRLCEPLSGQTATPPRSAAKDPSREIRRSAKVKMQNDQEPYLQSGTMGQADFLSFTSTSGDMFSYPMSAPATAPAYLNDKSFWDPDSSMTDVQMDFTVDTSSFYSTSQSMANSGDWTQNSQMFQDPSNVPLEQNVSQPHRRHRPLMSKPPASSAAQSLSNTAFDFGMASMPEGPYATLASNGAVNPGLIFSFQEATSPLPTNQNHDGFAAQRSTGQTAQEPYQHQQRESLRDQEELRRSRSMKGNGTEISYGKARFSSPVEGNRPGLRRAVSDNRPKKVETWKATHLPREGQPPANFAGKGVYSAGRQSPVKQGSRTNLVSIPEAAGFNPRTSVTFSIDANGRARTETTIIMDQDRPFREGRSRASSDGWESPQSGSSTDEDPIMIPSRNISFDLPNSRSMPKMAQFETSGQYRLRNGGSAKSSSLGDPDSETETIIDTDKSGDAASALRKVVGSRRRSVGGPPHAQQQVSSRKPTHQSFGRQTQYRRQSYAYQPSSSNMSPTTVTDPDVGTPSTDRGSTSSDSTRCVCNNRDGDEFMIQCESCEKWLHCNCVNVHPQRLPKVYICAFCVQTPNIRGPRIRDSLRASTQVAASPLAHKSFQSWR